MFATAAASELASATTNSSSGPTDSLTVSRQRSSRWGRSRVATTTLSPSPNDAPSLLVAAPQTPRTRVVPNGGTTTLTGVAGRRTAREMRDYWDEGARRNAVWYVDTSLDYTNPDIERFFETGRAIVSQALDDAPASPPGQALAVEIGCGLGRICKGLTERFDRVIGVDISPEMLRRAREHVPEPSVEFMLGDGVSLAGIETGAADLVLSFTVFQHIPSVEVICDYIAEAGRVLKPGGVFVFQWNNTPGAWRWRVRRGALGALGRVGIKTEKYGRNAPQFMGSRVPVSDLESAFRRGGLELEGVRGEGTLFAWAWARRQG